MFEQAAIKTSEAHISHKSQRRGNPSHEVLMEKALPATTEAPGLPSELPMASVKLVPGLPISRCSDHCEPNTDSFGHSIYYDSAKIMLGLFQVMYSFASRQTLTYESRQGGYVAEQERKRKIEWTYPHTQYCAGMGRNGWARPALSRPGTLWGLPHLRH